jgi:hypothetical protein
MAEVYVGRACASDCEEAKNFVDKTIAYMDVNSNAPYLKNVLMAGEYLWTSYDGREVYGGELLNKLIDDCNDNDYFTKGIPSSEYNIDKLYDKDATWTKEELYASINSNPHIINHDGHGNEYNIMKMDTPLIKKNRLIYVRCNDTDNVKNNKYFFLYSKACLAGDFTAEESHPIYKEDCITEYLTTKTKYGAFAAITNSRPAYGGLGSDGSGPADYFHREFWDAVFGEDIHELGRANQDSKEDNIYLIKDSTQSWEPPEQIRVSYYELNLFGDPAVKLKVPNNDNNPPNPPEIEGPTDTIKEQESIKLNISSTDPDDHQIYYFLDWGDGDYGAYYDAWTQDHYESGEIIRTNFHEYDYWGTYTIRVKAKDTKGAESEWSEFIINVKKTNPKINRFIFIHKLLNNNNIFLRLILNSWKIILK